MNALRKSALALISVFVVAPGLLAQTISPVRTYGEMNLVSDFLCAEVTYPEAALEAGVQGTVIISFIVTETGQVMETRIAEPVSPDLDAEALRLFSMLLWEPAVKLGQPVASTAEFSVPFNIKKYQKHCKQRGYDKTTYPFLPVDSSLTVYETTAVDKAPYALFQDKTMTLGRFINSNIRYPETAFKQNISGKVRLRFVIEPQGRVSNVKVVEPVSGGCTQEAIRLLQMVQWMPGIRDGHAVRTFMNMDINFKLPDDSDMKMFENSQMNSN
jgi:TonB family protein